MITFFHKHRLPIVLIVLMSTFAVFLLMTESGHRRDEKVHSRIVKKIVAHKIHTVADFENLTNVPGYHYVLATVASGVRVVLGDDYRLKHRHIRLMSVLFFGTLLVVVLYGIMRKQLLREETLLVIMTMPLVFLFTFMVYTDVAALALFLIGYLALLHRRHWIAALVFLATLLVRQDMILYIAAVVAIDSVRHTYGAILRMPTFTDVRVMFRLLFTMRYVPYYVLVALFAIFIIINGGVAMCDKQAHPAGALHWGNIYFSLMTFVIVLLPVVIATLPKIIDMLTRSWRYFVGFCIFGIVGYFFYDATFVIDHAYNFVTKDRFLHNDVLIAIATQPWARVVSYGVVLLALATLATVSWRRRIDAIVFAPFALLALSLHWLIEPRYALVPLVMGVLWMRLSRRMLWVQIIYGVVLCFFVYAIFIAKDNYFL